jgi:NhaP-type Na+/H+ or K+/H+ antiporter
LPYCSARSSTDTAAVFSVLRRLALRPRLRAALEAAASFNDPLLIILVTLVASDACFEIRSPPPLAWSVTSSCSARSSAW